MRSWFWGILTDAGWSLLALRERLEALTDDEVLTFYAEFLAAADLVNPWAWVECRPHLRISCSEDYGEDIGGWVVMGGRDFHAEVRGHPEAIMDYIDRYDRDARRRRVGRWVHDDPSDDAWRGCSADYIANRVWRARKGNDLWL